MTAPSKRTRPPFPYVSIEWLDACSDDEWELVSDTKFERHTVVTTGYVICENTEYVCVASAIGPKEGGWETSNRMFIPHGCILHRDVAKPPRRKK
jgi:hypothetical protein